MKCRGSKALTLDDRSAGISNTLLELLRIDYRYHKMCHEIQPDIRSTFLYALSICRRLCGTFQSIPLPAMNPKKNHYKISIRFE